MLIQYQQITRRLLNDQTFVQFNDFDLKDWINIARGQIAADGECIRLEAGLAVVAPTVDYAFSALTPVPALTSVGSAIAVRSARIGSTPLTIRSYEWYSQYYRGSATMGQPTIVAQRGQGVAGTLHLYPVPDAGYAMRLDTVYLPIDLVDDATAEAVPRLWVDAIPYYAAWMALLSVGAQDADQMFQRYLLMMRRARQGSTPSELPENLPGGLGSQVASTHQPLAPPPPPQRGQ